MEMIYRLSNDTWGHEEIEAAERVIHSGQFTMGENVRRFEENFAQHFGSKYAVMSNSGSSANLLMIAALVYSGKLQKGDEVLVTAVSWSTSYFPLEQMGLKTRLVDIDRKTLNVDLDKLEAAITPDTKAVLCVNLLGNPNDFERLLDIVNRRQLILVEDNCESMGAKYHGKQAGTFGLMGSFSTFFSHHMCTMEGGMTVTDDEEMYHYMLSIRAHGWTRQLPQNSKLYQKNTNEFYESFQFIMPGFNLRPLELEAAVGIEQLKKLDGFISMRRQNAKKFQNLIRQDERFDIQVPVDEASWFGFALILKEEYAGRRDQFVAALRAAAIECRPIVAGNFARQPAFCYMNATKADELTNADYVHENGLFVGNHSIALDEQLDLLIQTLRSVK